MQLLFNDTLFPLTSNIGFVETDIKTATEDYWSWQKAIKDGWGWRYEKQTVKGDLKTVLLKLLPFGEERRVLVPTKHPNWTAFFGGDVNTPIMVLSDHLQCRATRVSAVPHTMRGKGKDAIGRYGGTAMDIFDPINGKKPLNYLRSIAAIQEDRWSWDLAGQQQPFEEPEYYSAKRIKDKFPLELLDRYLKAIGISAFDETFYMPEGDEAVLFIGEDPKMRDKKKTSLEEFQMKAEGRVYFTG